MRTRNQLIVAVVAVVALLAGARAATHPNPADAAAPGGQTLKKAIWGPAQVGGRSLFPAFKEAGIGIYQVDLRWYLVAPDQRPATATDPADPAYKWSPEIDATIAEAGASGMEVAIRVIGAPRWSNGVRNPRFVPTDPQDFADFMVATSKRYPNVHLWMVWGEPNRESNFGPLTPSKASRANKPLNAAQQVAPRNYARILDATYGSLKAASPANKVIGGGTFTSAGANLIYPYQWIKYMKLPDGSRPRMDMYSHNPFSYHRPNLSDPQSPQGRVEFSDLDRLAKVLDQNFPGDPLPLYLAEWGVQAGGKRRSAGYKVSFKTQAKWIRAAYRIARSWDRVYTLGWVHALDSDVSPSGLFTVDGDPKPTYYAVRES